ncbi:MAG: LTA synthase family protein [bacterium]|nr:LTA synthase family protein [Candidatus Limimorpha caballi]
MKKYIVTLLKVLIFFMILFESMRLVFAVHYWGFILVDNVPLTEILKCFIKCLPLDISTACYMALIPAVTMFVGVCVDKKTNYKWLRWYFYIVIAVYIFIVMVEVGIYREWRTKLDYKALLYLQHPDEVLKTVPTSQMVNLLVTWFAFTILFCWWYYKWIEPTDKLDNKRKAVLMHYPVSFVLVLGLILVGMRGGFGARPISANSVCFSDYKLANVITVNPAYNMLESMTKIRHVKELNKFIYMDAEKAMRITEELHETDCDSTVCHISKIERPNILIVLLKSWSADLVESLGGDPSVTPNFHEMEKEGLLFTNIYASADRSQQAQANIFGGLPGLPITALTYHPEKYYAVPSLLAPVDSIGYYTSYYYGGALDFGKILPYLRHNKFDKIVEHKDVDGGFHSGKFGYHDIDMLPWVAKQLTAQPEPFFSTVFTLSSHMPYDHPKIFEELGWVKLEKEFMNSAHYVDYALKMFMDAAKSQPWYSNTIFVFVADHSHGTEKNFPLESFEYHHIPLLITGVPLQDSLRGKTFDKICSSYDLPATMLAQLGLGHSQFIWSKDVFNRCYRPFAFFELNGGFGWMTNEGSFIYSNMNGPTDVELPDDVRDSVIEQGKAYMQRHFELFRNY